MKLLMTTLTAMAVFSCATVAQESVSSTSFGNTVVYTLSEGDNESGSNGLIGATPEILKAALPDGGTYKRGMSSFLMQTPSQIILVDAGTGRNLQTNLKKIIVKPEDVDVILITHAHGDHIGGLTVNDKAAFPNATLYVAEPEYNYWAGNDRGASAMKAFNLYGNKLQKFTPAPLGSQTPDLVPGVKAYAAYGHTPGHTVFLCEDGNQKFLFWGDITHAMAIQIMFPQVALSFDTNPEQAIATRKAVLEYVTKETLPVLGSHIPFPCVGTITKSGNAYKYTSF
jgi:glyoxylase-like metal-dependent hydrolase (beta-lactamase superfamily II)